MSSPGAWSRMARARWPAEPPLEVPKLISSSRSYGSCRRTLTASSTLAGPGPPLLPKSPAAACAANTSATTGHQALALIPLLLVGAGHATLLAARAHRCVYPTQRRVRLLPMRLSGPGAGTTRRATGDETSKGIGDAGEGESWPRSLGRPTPVGIGAPGQTDDQDAGARSSLLGPTRTSSGNHGD